jgi:histone-lysine N-methyltransferase SETD8
MPSKVTKSTNRKKADTSKSRNKKENNEPQSYHATIGAASAPNSANNSPKKTEKIIQNIQSLLNENESAQIKTKPTKPKATKQQQKQQPQPTTDLQSQELFKETTNTRITRTYSKSKVDTTTTTPAESKSSLSSASIITLNHDDTNNNNNNNNDDSEYVTTDDVSGAEPPPPVSTTAKKKVLFTVTNTKSKQRKPKSYHKKATSRRLSSLSSRLNTTSNYLNNNNNNNSTLNSSNIHFKFSNRKITDYFQIRKSTRKCKSDLDKEKNAHIERSIKLQLEEGLEIRHIEHKGRGIFATRSFARGEFVCEYAGEIISYQEAKRREETYASDETIGCYMYFFEHKSKAFCIDATAETSRLGRLLNHSKLGGNCFTKLFEIATEPHLILCAAKDIRTGQELTYDYGDRNKVALQSHPWLKE